MKVFNNDLRLLNLRGKHHLVERRTRDIRQHYPVIAEYTEWSDEGRSSIVRHLYIALDRIKKGKD